MPTNTQRTTDLRTVLEAFRPRGPQFGEEETNARSDKDDLIAFRRNLQGVSAANRSYFLVCVAFLLVIFSGACYLIAHFMDKPQSAAAIFSITGVSFAGITTQMISLWKKKVSSDMLLVLAGQLRPADLKGITDVLLREYFK
jgi:hypothetical protein